MTISMKQKFTALLYYILVILAVHITGCRNATDTTGNDTAGLTDELTAPTNISVTVSTETEVAVTWTNTDFPELQKVLLQYKKTVDANFTEVDVQMATSHTLSSLQADTDYVIRMKSIDNDGNESSFSSEVAFLTTVGGGGGGNTDCPVANGLDATVISSSQVNLAWTWSNSNYSELDTYVVQRKATSATVWSDVQTITVSGSPLITYSNTGVPTGEIHYRIVSYCGANDYPSTASDAVTAVSVGSILPTPTGLTAPAYYNGNIEYLDWANYTGGPYNAPGGWITIEVESTVSGFAPTYNSSTGSNSYIYFTPPNCFDGTWVEYRIRAIAYNGSAFNSNWSNAITQLCP